MRLQVRRTHVWSSSYLVYRYLWPNLEAAAREATENRADSSRCVLDVGCGHKPYSDMFPGFTYIGVNNSLEDASPDIVANAECLPLATQSFDIVLCTQVLEHVPRPGRLLGECRRVLRPEGWLLLSAPFYWPIHEEPFDFFRFTKY